MAAVNRIQRISIDGWKQFDIGENFGVYIIAVKDKSMDEDTVNVNDVKNIVVELGIDSGVANKPIPTQRINLQFPLYKHHHKHD
jgi:hypothetical protein